MESVLSVEKWCQSPTGTNWIKWAVDSYSFVPAHVEMSRRLQPIPVYARKAA